MVIHLLYALEEKQVPKTHPKEKVYHIPGYPTDKIFVKFAKRLQLVLLNSKSRDHARRAIYSAVRVEKNLKLPKEVPSLEAEDLYPLMDAFEKKHHQIKQYFFTGIGIKLQNIDSQMAEQVLLHFSKMRYAILPVHDSFIIHHGLEQELKDAMNKAFKDLLDVDIDIDLKYNSITERSKQSGGQPYICDESLSELMEKISEDGSYGIYNKLSNQFEDYKQKPQWLKLTIMWIIQKEHKNWESDDLGSSPPKEVSIIMSML